MKIAICGSMSVAKSMLEVGKFLEENGHEVVLPRNTDKYVSGELQYENGHESTKNKIDFDLIRDYFSTIKEIDAVVVANCDKRGVANYIGGNSFLEMGFAHVLKKKIFLLNEIPEMIYSDELRAMQPVILNGNLSLIE